jgi:hypothetical protein
MKNAKKLLLLLLMAAGQSLFAAAEEAVIIAEGHTGVDPVSGTGEHGGVELNPTDGTGKNPAETPIADRGGDGKTDPTQDGTTPADQGGVLHYDPSDDGYGGSDTGSTTGTGGIQDSRGLITSGDTTVDTVIGQNGQPTQSGTIASNFQPGDLGDSVAQLATTIAKTTNPGNAQEALSAIEGDQSLTHEQKRDKVGEVMANVLTVAFETAETDPATLLKIEQDLNALKNSSSLADYERSAMEQTITELKTDVGAKLDEQVQLKTLTSVQDAYSNDMITKTDLIEVLNEIAAKSTAGSVTDKINEIQAQYLFVETLRSDIAQTEVAGNKSLVALKADSQQHIADITQALTDYSADKDTLLQQRFELLAQQDAQAYAVIQEASESANLVAQIITEGNRFAVVGKNGTVDIVETRADVKTLLDTTDFTDAAKNSLASSLIAGKGGIDAPQTAPSGFGVEVKQVQVEQNVKVLKAQITDQTLKNWLDTLQVQSDGSIASSTTGKVTEQQKAHIADAWLGEFEDKAVSQMSRVDLEKIAKAKEVGIPSGSDAQLESQKGGLRDLGQEFSSDLLFQKFLNEYYRDIPSELTEDQKTDLTNDFMASMQKMSEGAEERAHTGTFTGQELLAKEGEFVQKVGKLYQEWKTKQVAQYPTIKKDLTTALNGIDGQGGLLQHVGQQSSAEGLVQIYFDRAKVQIAKYDAVGISDPAIETLKTRYNTLFAEFKVKLGRK